jgi:hypothetical protein
MPVVTLNFTGIGAVNPATPPAGWLQLGSQQAKTDNTYFATAGAAQACWYYNTQLTGGVVKVKSQVGLVATLSSNRHGPFIINGTTGVGIQLWQSSATQLKISAISAAGNLTGADLHVITVPTLTDNCIFELWHTPATGSTQIAVNGVAQGVPYAGAVITNLMGGCYCFSTNFLRGLRNVSLEYGVSVDTITDPVVIGGPVAWTDTFSNNIVSITAAGLSATNINNTANTATWPMLADGQTITASLPITDAVFTFTDTAANTATIQADISLPAGFLAQTCYSAVNDDPAYLGYYTTVLDGYRFYYPSDGLSINSYGRITVTAPKTVTVYKHRIGDGNGIVALTLNITSEGEVTITRALKRSLKSSLKRPLKAIL